MNRHLRPGPRGRRGSRAIASVLALLALLLTVPRAARAQGLVAGGNFEIPDNLGSLVGKRARLTGRVGFGTERATFLLINPANSSQDIQQRGYTPGIDFTNLVVSDTTDFVNQNNPSQAILRRNLVIASFLNPLRNGYSNIVTFYVNVPDGTPAGVYLGRFTVRDTTRPPGLNPNGQAIRTDYVEVEINVLATSAIGLVRSDSAARADSLVLSGRPGQTVSGVVRVANTGNTPLNNVRLEVTDLIATSGTGLRIPATNVQFSPATLNTVAFGDTARLTVSVAIPVGVLAGSYRGELIAQGDNVGPIRIPITVNVITPGDIVFETNPVMGRAGDQAVIIFNADPGTKWSLAVFDMRAIIAFKAGGTVFSGSGTPATGVFPGNQAVRYTWNLQNGVGRTVAGGMYYVIVNAVQGGVTRQLRGKLMVIR